LAPVLCTLNWAQSRHGRWLPEASTHKKNTKGAKAAATTGFHPKIAGSLGFMDSNSSKYPMAHGFWHLKKVEIPLGASRQTAPWSGSNRHFTLREMAAMLDYNSGKKHLKSANRTITSHIIIYHIQP
jgi:hypothetical protein